MRSVKYFFLLVCTLCIIVPHSSFAQDARCFTEKECVERRRLDLSLNTTEAAEGFVQTETSAQACGGTTQPSVIGDGVDQVGFCLPAGKTKTQITFGGRNEFASIAEFIKFFYEYGFGIASILAVLVIIIAGLQWAISGGNTSTIQSAKKRIGGAIIGLILLALSYTILNFVNPRTLELRLPEIWMLNPAKLAPEYCQSSATGTLSVAKFATQDEINTLTPKEIQDRFSAAKGQYSRALAETAQCGTIYFVEGGGADRTCNGLVCAPKGGKNHVCGAKRDELFKDDCHPGDMIISTFSSGNAPGWEYPWVNPVLFVNSSVDVTGICTDGETFDLDIGYNVYDSDVGSQRQHIAITFKNLNNISTLVGRTCGGTGKEHFRGFVFDLDINENLDATDEDHFVGRDGKDLGDAATFEKIKTNSQIEPFLFTLEEVQNRKVPGQRIDIHGIKDIDNLDQLEAAGDEARYIYYKDLGFPNPASQIRTESTQQPAPGGIGGARNFEI